MHPQFAMAATKAGLKIAEMSLPAIVEMFKTYQIEATKRKWIEEHCATLLEMFRTQQENLLHFYELKFAERRASLEQFYELLHHAVETGDVTQLQLALYSILETIKTDPLADYDQFVVAYLDPNVQLEI